MNKIAVCTAITGGFDTLKDEQVTDGADFICFTDDVNLKSKTWKIKKANNIFDDPCRNAKIHKILIHKYLSEYEYTIWIDANIYLIVPAKLLIDKYLKDNNIALFRHAERNCIYKEAEACIKYGLDNIDTIQKQVSYYKEKGYPKNNGLHECTIILRKNCIEVEKLNYLWWSEVYNRSKRDQLSFDYCIYNLGLKVKDIEGYIRSNKYFRRVAHKRYEIADKNKLKPKQIIKKGNIAMIMNKQTSWKGEVLRPGQKVTVPQKIAERWNNRGLAFYSNWDNLIESYKNVKKYYDKHEKVSVVIPIKDQLEYVKKCIDSIRKYTENYELILIDNGSEKETKKYLANLKNIVLVTNEENMGVPYSWNQGVKLSTCNYICFINSDCVVTRNWLRKLMLTYRKMPNAGIVGPTTSFAGDIQCNRTVIKYRYAMSENDMNEFADSLEEEYIPLTVAGFCYLVKKEVFNLIGGFNYKRFKLGNTEENEFTWRMEHLTHYMAYLCRASYVHHYGHQTFKGLGIDPARYNSTERYKWENERYKVECEKFDISEVKVQAKKITPKTKKTITLTCKNRPDYTQKVINSLKEQNKKLDDWKLYINIDPGCKEVLDICKKIDFIETDIKIFKSDEPNIRKRIDKNTYDVMERTFSDGSDFNLYLEDDVIMSPDALNLMDWYTKQDLTDIASLSLCNLWDRIDMPDENLVYRVRCMSGWGFVISKLQFERYFKPAWLKKPSWDKAIANYIRTFEKVYNLVPQLSRTSNIGEKGTDNGNCYRLFMIGHKYNKIRDKKFNYYLQDKVRIF